MNLISSILKLCLLVAFIVTGCVTHKKDVTVDSQYKTDYMVGQVYRIRQPLFIEKLDDLVLKEAGQIEGGPNTIEEYEKSDKKKWPNVRGLLPVGTETKITRVMVEWNFEMGNMTYIYSKILGGSFGNTIADLSSVSKDKPHENPKTDLKIVDPEILELVRTE